MPKREDHRQGDEAQAKRELSHLGRRWPTNPAVYVVLVLVVLMLILILLLAR